MARELTREEKRKIRALVVKWCANYDKEYGCLPLECECYMFGKCWTGAYCRYFREAVLPLDPALEAALTTVGPRPDFKPCPICGNATPRLLPTKVEGVPICKECDKKIDLPNGVLDSMTLDDFRRYIDFYNKNQVLRERFHPEYRFGFGAFNTQLVLDVTNGLFRLKDDESTIVFEKSALKTFRITEDKEPLFTGTAAGLVCAESKNPERARLLAPRTEQFKLQRSDYERIMQAERVQYLDRTNEEWRERERELEFHKPEFRESSPFRQFVV